MNNNMSVSSLSYDFDNYGGGNLSHFKVGLLDYFTFIVSSAGLDILKDIIMIGICNISNKNKIWKFTKSLSWLKIGVTILNDNEGTIDAIETRCDNQYHNTTDVSSSNERRMFLQRIYQALMIIFRLIATHDETTKWQTHAPDKSRDVDNVYLSEHSDFQRPDILCSKLINDMKKKKGPTRVWMSLKHLYNNDDDESNRNDNNSDDDESNYEIFMAHHNHDDDDRKTRSIAHYTYDEDDIVAMNHFFSSSSTHKVTCCNPKHRDRNPSMHLYRRPSVWMSRIEKCNPTKEEFEHLKMQECEANESNVSTFRGSKILLFTVSAHCYSCDYHVHLLSKSELKKVLSEFY